MALRAAGAATPAPDTPQQPIPARTIPSGTSTPDVLNIERFTSNTTDPILRRTGVVRDRWGTRQSR